MILKWFCKVDIKDMFASNIFIDIEESVILIFFSSIKSF